MLHKNPARKEKIAKLQAQKPSLVRNINLAKLGGTAKTKNKTTISKSAYSNMQSSWKK